VLPAALGPPRPLPPDLLAARAQVDATLRELLALPDRALRDKAADLPSNDASTDEAADGPPRFSPAAGFGRTWPWLGSERADIRYGFYHLLELIERGRTAVVAAGGKATQAGLVLGDATAALWDLHGLLLPLEGLLDRDPGGEWTLRQTLAHVIAAQREGAIHTAYAVHRLRDDPTLPLQTPEEIDRGVPEEAFAAGDLAAIRRRTHEWHDVAVGWLAGIDDDAAMAAGTIWVVFETDVRYRLHRYLSHLREHAVQIEKTLAALDHRPTEVARIVRVLAHAYGRLEAEVIARLGAEGRGPAVAALAEAVERAGRHARELLTAAE
jgi:hypothetical protein